MPAVAKTANAAVFRAWPSGKPALEAMTKLCKQRYEEFGTAGKASKIRVIPLNEMAKSYKAGKLEPKFA